MIRSAKIQFAPGPSAHTMNKKKMTEGTAKKLAKMLGPRVDTRGIGSEKDPEKINAIAFELYKESLSVVDLVAHLLDETASVKGGWPRNQAICAGLMVRISKFMLVVTQLSATGGWMLFRKHC
jgi:hypothetical protein